MPGVRASGWPLLVLLVVLAIGFSACASSQDSAQPTTAAKPTTGTSSPPSPAPNPAAAPAPPTPPPPPPPPPPGHGPTLVDYVKSNHIVEIAVHPGDPGAPTINLPLPKGWKDAGNRTPPW